jgi:hypothetical protein
VRLPELCALLDLFVDHSESNLSDKVQWDFTDRPPGQTDEEKAKILKRNAGKVKLLKELEAAKLLGVLRYSENIFEELQNRSVRYECLRLGPVRSLFLCH